MIDRIKLSAVADSHFCALRGVSRVFKNAKYRSLLTEAWQNSKGYTVLNIIQVADAKTLRDLKFKYAEDCSGLAVSSIERCFARLEFGLGDIRNGAQHMLLEYSKIGMTSARLARWLKDNCSGDVVILEGHTMARISFDNDEDFVLAKINFS